MFAFYGDAYSLQETKEERETRQFLDSLPLDTFLNKYDNLRDVIDRIEEEYGDKLEDNPIFQGYVFNWMSADEFADYLRAKNYLIHEDVTINYIIGGKRNDTD